MRLLASLPGRLVTAWFVVLAAVGAVVLVALLPVPDPLEPRSSSGLPGSYESVEAERAVEALDEELGTVGVPAAVVVASRSDGDALTPGDLEAVTAATAGSAANSPTGDAPPIPAQPSPDGTVAVVAVPLAADLDDEGITEAVDTLREDVSGLSDGLVVQVTGGPGFTADINAIFAGADLTILLATAGVVGLLLLLTYRSPLLVLVPLLVIAAAEQTVLRLVEIVLAAVGLAVDPATTGIVSVLVFGAATNYALLLIARYREQLREQDRPADAMRTALERAGTAVFASGATVVLAVLALLLAATESTQSLGVAAAVGITIAVVAGLVVLPCALVVLGRAAFWPFIPRLGSTGREGALWQRVGGAAARRPAVVALVGAAVIIGLSVPALTVPTGLSQSEQFRDTPEAVLGAETLASGFPAGAFEPVQVLTPPDTVDAVVAAAGGVTGVAGAEAVREGADLAQVDVVLEAEPTSEESFDTLRALRDAVQDPAVGGEDTVLGGTVATALDVSTAQTRDRQVIIPVVLAAVLLVLVVLLRALVAPVLLLVAVVSTYAAAVGASWLVLGGLLDQPALDVPVLLLSFVFIVALGVDYSIFLTTRAREEAALHGTGPGMLTALRATGGVITSAGVVLAAVFAVLGVLPVITLTQIGVIVGIGVLLDTLVVRTLLVPSMAFLLRERFWWPATVDPVASASPPETDRVDVSPSHENRSAEGPLTTGHA